MPSFSAISNQDGENQQQSLIRQLDHDDPRVALKLRLDVREKIIAAIEARLRLSPDDTHQLFILEEHSKAREALRTELKRLNLETDLRYQNLDAYVDGYVQELEQEKPEMSRAHREAMQTLDHEQKTWEDLIAKVRARLIKRPGDPLLMKLLAEHQARLLHVQQNRQMIWADVAVGDTLVLESVYQEPQNPAPTKEAAEPTGRTETSLLAEPDAANEITHESLDAEKQAQLASLLREYEVFKGMIEKTRQRMQLKPELLHLQPLITQHEARLREIQCKLSEFGEA